MAEQHPDDLGTILGLLRIVRGANQADVARAAGVSASGISDYERGRKIPQLRTLERIVTALGFQLSAVEETRTFLRFLRSKHSFASPADRAEAPLLWKRLKQYPAKMQQVLIRESKDFQRWALVELICLESAAVAADDASEALALAELALAIAEQMPSENPWAFKVRGFAWAHLGNARRVGGDLAASDEAFATASGLWRVGRMEPADFLEGARVLAMEASLRTAQRRLGEALELLERAEAADRHGALTATLLVSKAKVLEEQGDLAGAIALLRQAEPLVRPETEPRLSLCLEHNLVWLLATAGSHKEARTKLQSVSRRTRSLGNALDLVRLTWAEGRIAAAAGDEEGAIRLLSEVFRQFVDRRIWYDAALASLELAAVYTHAGRTADVKLLARHLVPIFQAQDVHREALAALALFRKAAEREEVTAEFARRVSTFLEKARHDATLRFEG